MKKIFYKCSKEGFTLLELLTVMAIMVIMMSIAGASYYGMSRGAAMRGSVSNLTTALSLARQFSVNHRKRTHVKLWKDTLKSNYQVFVEVGRNKSSIAEILWLETIGIKDNLKGGYIYKLPVNLDPLKLYDRGKIFSFSYETNSYGAWITEIKASNEVNRTVMKWGNNDKAAWSIQDTASLFDGIEYVKKGEEVVFYPDGTASEMEMGIKESRGDATKTVHVSLFGKIWAE